MTASVAYKVFTAEQWARFQSDRIFHGAPVDVADGFIHLSTEDQLQGTLDKHFAGQSGLVVAEINLDTLGDLVKWEVSRGGALFPHVYGRIELKDVLGWRVV